MHFLVANCFIIALLLLTCNQPLRAEALHGQQVRFDDTTVWRAASKQAMTNGTVYLVHDLGLPYLQKPLFPELIERLSQHGWHVISVPLPEDSTKKSIPRVLSPELRDTLATRLSKIISAASIEKTANIVIAQGQSAYWLADLITQGKVNCDALVTLSIYHPDPPTNEQSPSTLKALSIPVLDVYAQYDNAHVLHTTNSRLFTNRSKKTRYRQLMLPNAEFGYRHQGTLLSDRIAGWLKRWFLTAKKRNK